MWFDAALDIPFSKKTCRNFKQLRLAVYLCLHTKRNVAHMSVFNFIQSLIGGLFV